MAFFDLHCDTISECARTGQGLRENGLALSLSKGLGLSPWCQTFALFLPDELRGEAAVRHYEKLLAVFRREMAANADLVTPCRTAGEILQATSAGRCAALLAVENGSALAGDLDRVDRLAEDGVRLLTLTWNGDNELGGGAKGQGGGLTAFGRKAVRRMREKGIFCDVSHLSDRSFWDVAELGDAPLIATHSNFRSVCDHRRNLTDDQFRAIVASGGLVGLNFYRSFLGGEPFEAVYAHLSHALDLGGEDCVAFGSDFDGAEMDFPLNSVDKMADLCENLEKRGLPSATLEKLCWGNALRLFRKEEDSCITPAPATGR